jgi:hypothetical protein
MVEGEQTVFRILHFDTTPSTLPNKTALQFQKAACLIWNMAGGGDPDFTDEDVDEEMVDPVRSVEVSLPENLDRVAECVQNSSQTVIDVGEYVE